MPVPTRPARRSLLGPAVGRGRWPVLLATIAALLDGLLVVGAAPVARAATVDPTAWYVLVNWNSGKALDVSGVSISDGATIHRWTRHDGLNQQWQFVDSGGGFYRLRARHSGKVADACNFSTADGAEIVQWSDGNGTTISSGRIWLRVNADIRPGTGRQGYAIFNYAIQSLGGAVTMSQFTLTGGTPAPSRVVSLRAHANGRYVTADNAGAIALIANRTTIGTSEQFDLIG
jgi:hypothetical protein